MFEWFFAESYHKFDENDPGRQLRKARGEGEEQQQQRRRRGDDGGFFSCDAILGPCVGISEDTMLARTTTTTMPAHRNLGGTVLSKKDSGVATTSLYDVENAVVWNEWKSQQSKLKLTTSTVSKQSQSTAPSNESETLADDEENNSSIVTTMDHHTKQADWEAFKEEEETRYNRRCRMWIILCSLLAFLIVGSIGLGVGLAMQKKNASMTAASANQEQGQNLPPTDEQGGGSDIVFESTFGPSDYLTDDFDTEDFDEGPPVQLEDGEGNESSGLDVPPLDMNYEEGFQYDYTANTDYLVGVYYYPWHGNNFHNGDGYLRKELVPSHQPALGEYDDSRPEVIAQHMRWFRKANIGLLVTSWWGPNRLEDTNTKDVIMEHEDVGNLKIALHYETTGRIKGSDMSTARSDMQYLCEHYFDHPNYYHIDGRPVLVIYITRRLHNEGLLEEALLTMRSEASKCGHNLYLIGDQVFASAPDPDAPFVPFWYFDAVTNYDVYGSSGRPSPYANRTSVDSFYAEQQKWREQALKENCRFIPPVSPGYNDRAVRLENNHPPLSRRLSATDEEGSLFWYQLTKALPLVDPEIDNMILVNSFNEWHEDTQIEPVVGTIPTNQPDLFTGGLQYVPYGELYLDILQAATTKGSENMFNYFFDRNR